MPHRFEIHVTVRALPSALAALRAQLAQERRPVAVTHIVLAHGRHPSQVLLTQRVAGTAREALVIGEQLTARLASDVEVLRLKIERDLSGDDDGARGLDDVGYYEHHVKIALPGALLPELARLADRLDAHLSRNAFAAHDATREVRFLTQRFAVRELDRARESLGSLLRALSTLSAIEVVDVEREHVMLDTHVALDEGWCRSVATREIAEVAS